MMTLFVTFDRSFTYLLGVTFHLGMISLNILFYRDFDSRVMSDLERIMAHGADECSFPPTV